MNKYPLIIKFDLRKSEVTEVDGKKGQEFGATTIYC